MTSAQIDEGFTREISVKPSFDHRFDPEQWQRGCGSMELHFILRGPLGAVTASVMTGWMYEPLIERPSGYGGWPQGPWGNERRAIGEVGPDCISRDRERPLAGPISCHVATPPAGKEWFSRAEGCTLVQGGICYGDSGYVVGDTFLAHLGSGGSQAGFAFLREIHDDWLAPAEAPMPEQADEQAQRVLRIRNQRREIGVVGWDGEVTVGDWPTPAAARAFLDTKGYGPDVRVVTRTVITETTTTEWEQA